MIELGAFLHDLRKQLPTTNSDVAQEWSGLAILLLLEMGKKLENAILDGGRRIEKAISATAIQRT